MEYRKQSLVNKLLTLSLNLIPIIKFIFIGHDSPSDLDIGNVSWNIYVIGHC